MQFSKSEYNPLAEILELFPSLPQFCTVSQLRSMQKLLELGGVHANSNEELVQCLDLFRDLGVLHVEKVHKNSNIYLKVGNKLNGKVTQQNS